MSKFDEQREDILGEIGELGGFDEAKKTASADEDADEEISTEKLAETLGKMAGDMPGEDGEVGDGTNTPNEESAPSGESAKNDRQESGVSSGESSLDDGEQSGVPSGEQAVDGDPGTSGDSLKRSTADSARKASSSSRRRLHSFATTNRPRKCRRLAATMTTRVATASPPRFSSR